MRPAPVVQVWQDLSCFIACFILLVIAPLTRVFQGQKSEDGLGQVGVPESATTGQAAVANPRNHAILVMFNSVLTGVGK